MQSAALRLGKALNDPVRRLSELSETGVFFTQAQQETIRALAESGRMAEAQAQILDVLESQYADTARAARGELGGALKALGNTWGDLFELSEDAGRGIAAHIEGINRAIGRVDVAELYHDLVNLSKVGFVALAAFAGRTAVALTVFGGRAAYATVKTQALALGATKAAAKVDAARFRMIAGAAAAHRYGGAVRGASVAVRGLSRVMALLGGPAGIALAAGYAVWEFSRSSGAAAENARELADEVGLLAGSVDEYAESLANLNRGQLRTVITEYESDLAALQAARGETQKLLDAGFETRTVMPGDAPFGAPIKWYFRADEIQALRDSLADGEEEIARTEASIAALNDRLEALRNPASSGGGAAAAEIGAEAQRILDAQLGPAAAIETKIQTLEEAREKLLELASAGAQIDAGDLNALAAGIVSLRTQLAEIDAPESGAADEYLASLRSRLASGAEITAEAIEAQYRADLIHIQTLEGDKTALLLALEAERDERLSSLREQDAEREAEERRIASGVPALAELTAKNAALRQETDFGREAVALRNREAQREIELADAYPDAAEGVLAALRAQWTENDRLLRRQEIKTELLERHAPESDRQIEREEAIQALYAAGALAAGDYAAAMAELNMARGEGSFADGLTLEIERVRDESRNAAAEIGTAFGQVFGPDGQLAVGLSDSVARMIVFGESSRETFQGVMQQAVSGFISQLIQLGIQWVLLNTVFRGTKAAAAVSEVASVMAQTTAMSAIAAQNAYAAAVATPIIGPAIAPGAAAQAGGVAAALGVAGEAGPEAILPLARGPDGNLGVRAAGAGGDRPIQVHIHVNATDADGFDELLRRRRNLIAGMVGEALAEDRRS